MPEEQSAIFQKKFKIISSNNNDNNTEFLIISAASAWADPFSYM